MSKWSQFNRKGLIKAPVPQVYAAWTTTHGLLSWFLRTADFKTPDGEIRRTLEAIQPGDTYTWLWHGHDDHSMEEGQILAANGRDYIQFRFAGNCLVDVKMTHQKEGTLVEIIQSEIPEEPDPSKNLYVNCLEGWTFFLANLKSILEGGVDLRNKNNALNMN